jgi:hypothetical protein
MKRIPKTTLNEQIKHEKVDLSFTSFEMIQFKKNEVVKEWLNVDLRGCHLNKVASNAFEKFDHLIELVHLFFRKTH